MAGTQYTPDMQKLSANAQAIRDQMMQSLRGPQGEGEVVPLPVPGTPSVTALPPQDLRTTQVGGAGLYGAEGDPWVYEVADGGMRVKSPGGEWSEVPEGSTMALAIQRQIDDGALQPGAGAAAVESAPTVPEGAPEPQAPFIDPDLSPEQQAAVLDVEGTGLQSEPPAPGGFINPDLSPEQQAAALDVEGVGPQSPAPAGAPSQGPSGSPAAAMRAAGAAAGHPGTPDMAQMDMASAPGGDLNPITGRPMSPVRPVQHPMREFIKSLIREAVAEEAGGR